MGYLILAITFSSLFPISFRVLEKLHFHSKTTIFLNYLFGSIYSLIAFIILFQDTIAFKPMLIAILLGIPTGTIYYIGLVLYQQSISINGLSISALFMKIAMVIPIVLSIIIFFERPSYYQYGGILLAIIAIIVINGGIKQFKGVTKLLILLFLISGIGDFLNKVYEASGDINYQTLFIFSIFTTATIISYTHHKNTFKPYLNKLNILGGLTTAVFNVLSSYFIITTFTVMPASITFVLLNTSIIFIVSIVGILFFKERLKRNELLAFLLALISIFLMRF